MAINSDKLLNRPSELHRRYGGRLAMQKAQQEKMVSGGPVNFVLTKKSIKNIETIKVKVTQIESILKGTLASEKKALDEKKRKDSGQRREKLEEKLETKPNAEKGSIKMPSAPRMGILEWIKNFIGNVLLGYFAVRLVEHLPKIIPIVKFLGNAADFIINVGGKLLNGLATFIDWGYKAFDATRGFIKNIGGEKFAQGFDKFVGAIDTTLFLATIIAGDLLSEALFGDSGEPRQGPGPRRGGRPQVTTSGGGASGRPDIRNPLRQRPTVTTGQGGKPGGFRLPGTGPKVTGSGGGPKIRVPKGMKARGGLLGLVFLIPDLIDAGMLVSQGRGKDGLRALLSAVSGVVAGMAAYSATLAGAAALGITGVGLPAAIGLAVAGFVASAVAGAAAYNLADAGLKKMGLFDKDPKTGKPYTYKSGGITRGGKRQTGARRTIGGTKARKYKRVVPRKPGEVEIKPGADVGGEDKIFGIFPNPLKAAKKAIDVVNPFKVVKTAGEDLGKTDYFGPILAITSKITLGQKATQKDYENVGLGINMLIAKGIQEKQLKGGVVAAFAEGGLVDPDVLSAVETGGDISNWVAKTFQGEIESNAQKTLRMIRENADKKGGVLEEGKSGGASGDEGDGGGGGIMMGTSFDNGLARLLKSYEGLRTAAYRDAKGIPTIGMGATYYPPGFRLSGAVKMGQTITEDEALWIKMQHIKEHRNRLLRDISASEYAKVPDNVKAALESKTFNYGSLGSTLAGLVKEGIKTGNYKPVSDYFRNTLAKHDGGLNSWRRNDEAGLIDRGISQRAKVSFPKSAGGQAIAEYNQRGGMADEPSGSLPSGVKGGSLRTGPSSYIGGSTAYHIDTKFHKSLGMGNMVSAMDKLANAYNSRGRKIEFSNAGVSGAVWNPQASSKEKQSLLKRAIDAHSHSRFMRAEGFLPFDYYNPKKNDTRFGKSVEGSEILLPTFGGKVDVGKKYGGYGKSAEIYSGNKMVAMTGHGDVRYEAGGETLPYEHIATVSEDGRREIIVDNDSAYSSPQVKNMLLAMNQAKGYKGVMQAIQQYAPYDMLSPQTIFVPVSDGMGSGYGDSGEFGDGVAFIPVGGGSDPFEMLHRGG